MSQHFAKQCNGIVCSNLEESGGNFTPTFFFIFDLLQATHFLRSKTFSAVRY